MKFKKIYLLQLSAMSISPVLGLLLSILSSLEKGVSPLALSVSLALIFCYFPLMYDVSHSFFSYIDFANGYLDEQLHAINVIAGFVTTVIDLDYYYIVFFISAMSFYLWFKMFIDVVGEKNTQKYYILIFLVFILALTYKESIDLNRSYFAYMISVYAIFKYIDKPVNFKPGLIILFGISLYLHSSSAVIILIYFISKYLLLSKKNAFLILFGSLFLGLTFGFFINYIVLYIPQSSLLSYLVSEKWGIVKNISIGHVLLWSVQIFVVAALYYISIPYRNLRQFSIFIMLSAVFLTFIQFRVFGERFFIIVVMMIPLVLINIQRVTKGLYVLLLAMSIKFFAYNFYIFGYIFTDDFNQVIQDENVRYSFMIKPLIMPTIGLLYIHEFGYSDNVIKEYSTRRQLE